MKSELSYQRRSDRASSSQKRRSQSRWHELAGLWSWCRPGCSPFSSPGETHLFCAFWWLLPPTEPGRSETEKQMNRWVKGMWGSISTFWTHSKSSVIIELWKKIFRIQESLFNNLFHSILVPSGVFVVHMCTCKKPMRSRIIGERWRNLDVDFLFTWLLKACSP